MKATELIVGDTWDFETSVPDYPNTDGWTLTYRLVLLEGTGSAITFNATGTPVEDALGYRVQLAPATTAAYTAGQYAWYSYLVKSGARQTVEQGQVTLLPDPAVTTVPTDNRSHARKVLAAIEAVLEGRASKDQEEYSIKDRQLKRTPIPDLLKLRSRYLSEVAAEDAAANLANGTGLARKIQVRI